MSLALRSVLVIGAFACLEISSFAGGDNTGEPPQKKARPNSTAPGQAVQGAQQPLVQMASMIQTLNQNQGVNAVQAQGSVQAPTVDAVQAKGSVQASTPVQNQKTVPATTQTSAIAAPKVVISRVSPQLVSVLAQVGAIQANASNTEVTITVPFAQIVPIVQKVLYTLADDWTSMDPSARKGRIVQSFKDALSLLGSAPSLASLASVEKRYRLLAKEVNETLGDARIWRNAEGVSQIIRTLARLLSVEDDEPRLFARDGLISTDHFENWNTFFGFNDVKEEFYSLFVMRYMQPQLVSAEVPPRGSLVLYGPSGNNLNSLVGPAVKLVKGNLFEISGKALAERSRSTGKNFVKSLFQFAEDQAGLTFRPSIINISDLEELMGDANVPAQKRLQLYDQIVEQLRTVNNVYFIGTTHNPKVIDRSILKALGDRRVYVGLPDQATREQLFRRRLSSLKLTPEDFTRLAENSARFTRADISRACRDIHNFPVLKASKQKYFSKDDQGRYFAQQACMVCPKEVEEGQDSAYCSVCKNFRMEPYLVPLDSLQPQPLTVEDALEVLRARPPIYSEKEMEEWEQFRLELEAP